MKRIFIGAVAALLLIAANGTALAQERTEVEVGVKFWFNDWTHDVPGASITSDTTALFGPTIEVKFPNQVFVEGSYLVSTSDYDFPDDTRFDRQDLELAIGYMIVPGFGVLAGYKNSSFKERAGFDVGLEDKVYGPLIGVIGIAEVNPYFSFYGKFDYLFTKFKETVAGSAFEEDNPGWIFEVGVKFGFTREVFGNIGYKYETNEGNDSNVRDTFSGLTLGALVKF
ncbi:MAG TPA: outer membrane beta-barrel protein [Nitrospirota bacterium]|nr:outer membrane beta-barrel protein [Nitrospirota bacterium]